MYVLVACEESQVVCSAFREFGHIAFSCDIKPCSGGHPEWHILGDCLPLLNGRCSFTTCDGVVHSLSERWDLIIAHPPCTYLTPAGACNIPSHPERIDLGFLAKDFFINIFNSDCIRIAIENPPPMKRFDLPIYSQIVRPYFFGDVNNKPIALWLKNLPLLYADDVVEKDNDVIVWTNKKTGKRKSCSRWYNTNTHNHSEHRSKFFPGVARAMAEQWGSNVQLYFDDFI